MASANRKPHFSKLIRLALTTMIALTLFTSSVASAATTDMNLDMQNHNGKFYSDYGTGADLMQAAKELAEEIGEEGFILVKNLDNTLPLADVKNISVFGKASINPGYGGGGSGAIKGVAVSLYDALHNAGFNTNSVLEVFYESDGASGTGRADHEYTNETPLSAYTDAITSSYSNYNDAAIIVLTRTGAEGSDLPRTPNANGYDEGTPYYLAMTQEEKDLVDHVTANFDKVVVIVNASNTMELDYIANNDKVQGILVIGNPGQYAMNAVGSILRGTVNPSGRLVDIYVSDLTKDPTWANFGNNSQNAGVVYYTASSTDGVITYTKNTNLYNELHAVKDEAGNLMTTPAGAVDQNGEAIPEGTQVYEVGGTFTDYEEGIYVGYRYYETAAYEAANGNFDGFDYTSAVNYTFGYGLSYTSFDWEIVEATSKLEEHGTISVDVKVTNTGDVAGKDVVELYYSAPYTKGGIEKSVVNLGAYAKTKLLNPGESEIVNLTMYVQDMSSFDWNDANGNGFKGYELEAGDYTLYLGKDAHVWAQSDALKLEYNLASGIQYTTDTRTGNPIEVLFSGNDIYNSNLWRSENGLSRADFAGTAITEKTVEEFVVSDDVWETIYKATTHVFAIEDDEGTIYAFDGEEHAPWYVDDVPATWKQAVESEDRPAPTYTFSDIAGWDFDDARWETVLNELTWNELKALTYTGGFKNASVPYIGKAVASDNDGPMQIKSFGNANNGFQSAAYPSANIVASTWNVPLAERQGIMIGNEGLYLGVNGWFAPAMNLHRNQFGGRIFEYYSSDPVQGGFIAAAVTRGVQSKGVYCYLKHFALNNQDTGRGSISIAVNEQAMRELYMYTFELAVEEGGAHGFMTYYSYVGGNSIMHNYAILTSLVRDQWGFTGIINHDYGPEGYTQTICNPALTRRAGNGMAGGDAADSNYVSMDRYDPETNKVYYLLDNTGNALETPVESATQWAIVRKSAKELLWVTANSSNNHNGVALDLFADKSFNASQGQVLSIVAGVPASDLGTTIVNYAIVSGELPAGVSFDAATGSFNGTPSVCGDFAVTVQLTAEFWMNKTATFVISVAPAFTVDATEAVVGQEFYAAISSETINTDNGFDSVKFAVSGLPAGLELDGETGEIFGTPTQAGTYDVTLTGIASMTTQGRWGPNTTTYTYDVPVQIVVSGN